MNTPQVDRALARRAQNDQTLEQATEEILRLRKQITQLRMALLPFVNVEYPTAVDMSFQDFFFTNGAFRLARQVWNETDPDVHGS